MIALWGSPNVERRTLNVERRKAMITGQEWVQARHDRQVRRWILVEFFWGLGAMVLTLALFVWMAVREGVL